MKHYELTDREAEIIALALCIYGKTVRQDMSSLIAVMQNPVDIASKSKAARDVLAERKRQIEVEGWTPEHDDQYQAGELAYGAAAYILFEQEIADEIWPFDIFMFKPRSVRENLVRAGAMIQADIERLDRAESRGIHRSEQVDTMQKRYEFLTSDNGCHLDWSLEMKEKNGKD